MGVSGFYMDQEYCSGSACTAQEYFLRPAGAPPQPHSSCRILPTRPLAGWRSLPRNCTQRSALEVLDHVQRTALQRIYDHLQWHRLPLVRCLRCLRCALYTLPLYHLLSTLGGFRRPGTQKTKLTAPEKLTILIFEGMSSFEPALVHVSSFERSFPPQCWQHQNTRKLTYDRFQSMIEIR
jgi:hypothetical protein